MKYGFERADFDGLASLWNEFYPSKFHVDGELIRLNSVESPVFDWGASRIIELDGQVHGFTIVKKSPSSLYSFPDKDQAYLSAIAFREPTVGADLITEAKHILYDRGASKLVYGSDSRHFFPGVPAECSKLQFFLEIEGFMAAGESFDLERDLTEYVNPAKPVKGDRYETLTDAGVDALDRFLQTEFPGRWHYDVMHKVGFEGPQCVFAVWRGKELVGFALLHEESATVPIGGAVWRRSLGKKWGSLGPIGVSQSVRGQGTGNALLGEALSELKRRGVHRCIIDWTGLVDFYGKHGFETTRAYRSMALSFDHSR